MTKPTITDLTPDAENTNRHTERGTGMTRKSVAKFGPRKPIELDKDGRIIDGNSRQEIYADVDLNDLEIIDHTPGKIYAIRYPDFDLSNPDNPAREYQVAQARTAQLSLDFDPQAMEFHAGEGVDFGEWFFDWEWEELTADENEQPESHDAESQTSRADELQEIWQVETGDLWRLPSRTAGHCHYLICGDCTDRGVVERVMGGERADIEIHDPPYGMDLDTDFSGMESKMFKGKTGGAYDAPILGDNKDFDPTHLLKSKSKELFLWGADYYCERIPCKNSGSWFVWDKRLDESADKMWGSCFETLWSRTPHKRDLIRIKWAGIFGMEGEPGRERKHPTQKPVGVYEWLLNRYSQQGDITADYYMGAGSHLLAAENLSRQCRAIEIAPAYCAVILQRYRDAFGIEPELIPSPEQRPLGCIQ